jgi:hypothetical protein
MMVTGMISYRTSRIVMKTGSIILTPEQTMKHGMTSHHTSKESQNIAFGQ